MEEPEDACAGPARSMLRTCRKRSHASRACCVEAPRRSVCVQKALEYALLWSAEEKLKADSSGYGETFPAWSTSLPISLGTSALPPTKWCVKKGWPGPSLATASMGMGSGCPFEYSVCAVPGW